MVKYYRVSYFHNKMIATDDRKLKHFNKVYYTSFIRMAQGYKFLYIGCNIQIVTEDSAHKSLSSQLVEKDCPQADFS